MALLHRRVLHALAFVGGRVPFPGFPTSNAFSLEAPMQSTPAPTLAIAD
jgi:hypothetical protein